MDVSSRTADVLGFKGEGTAKIKVEYVGQAPMEGSDDSALLASLRTDGSPANLNGYSATMVASAEPGPSLFAALFSSGRGAPRPAPEPEPIRIAEIGPVRAAEVEPVRAAEVEPPPAPVPERAPPAPAPERERMAPPAAVAMHRGPVPLPPPRPFDLGAIHRAAVVAAAPAPKGAAPVAVLPPRRPLIQASADRALYFSSSSEQQLKRIGGAFERVKSAGFDDEGLGRRRIAAVARNIADTS